MELGLESVQESQSEVQEELEEACELLSISASSLFLALCTPFMPFRWPGTCSRRVTVLFFVRGVWNLDILGGTLGSKLWA